jgi:hypothetical protein
MPIASLNRPDSARSRNKISQERALVENDFCWFIGKGIDALGMNEAAPLLVEEREREQDRHGGRNEDRGEACPSPPFPHTMPGHLQSLTT